MADYLGEGFIGIKADIKEAQDLLTDLGLSRKTINKAILRSVGTGGRQAVRRNYKSVLNKRTGNLYKGITSYVYKNGTQVVFTDNADSGKKTSKDGRIARYGFMLASGYTINPKVHDKPMRFQINGKWVSKYSVTVPPKDWVEAPISRYVDSADCKDRIDTAFQKQVDKWEKKYGGTAS